MMDQAVVISNLEVVVVVTVQEVDVDEEELVVKVGPNEKQAMKMEEKRSRGNVGSAMSLVTQELSVP